MKRIFELDGLRGVAISLVLFFHYINNTLVDNTSQIGRILYKLTSPGWIGVDLFFVLSGFLIGRIVFKEEGKKFLLWNFYIRRMIRIIPIYYILVFLHFLILNLGYFTGNYFLTGFNNISLLAYFTLMPNIYMGLIDHMGTASMTITWSIGVEEQFYLLFPILLLLFNKKQIPYLLLSFIILAHTTGHF